MDRRAQRVKSEESKEKRKQEYSLSGTEGDNKVKKLSE
jgi:hypothetical protein